MTRRDFAFYLVGCVVGAAVSITSFCPDANASPYPTLKRIVTETHRRVGDRGAFHHVLLSHTRCRAPSIPARRASCRFTFSADLGAGREFTRYGSLRLVRRHRPAVRLVDQFDAAGWIGADGWFRVDGRQFRLVLDSWPSVGGGTS